MRHAGGLSRTTSRPPARRWPGCSVRTVHTHAHRLKALVGAETGSRRGMEAVRRGWV